MTAPTAVTSARPAAGPSGAERPMMGGRAGVLIADNRPAEQRRRIAGAVLDRIGVWAGVLTRFDPDSELCRLNDDPASEVAIGPTLAAVLDWARAAESLTGGLVDVSLLDARLWAEHGGPHAVGSVASRRWSLRRTARGSTVLRDPGVRFDLDGVAKGWLADRALAIVPAPTAIVDGDGDMAVRLGRDEAVLIGVDDPRSPGGLLGTLRLAGGPDGWTFGLGTSGTSVHRWAHSDGARHHIVDPRTSRPAVSDVVQATVLGTSARAAEALAKAAVIAGSEAAFTLLGNRHAHGALLLTESGQVLASGGLTRWLA